METGELLKNLRQIVREETALAMEDLGKRMDARFDQVDTWFDGVYVRLERLEMEGQAIKAALARLELRMENVESRLRGVESRLELVESGVQSMDSRLGDATFELQSIKSELVQVVARVLALETRLAGMHQTVGRLAQQSEVLELKQQVAMLNDRVAALEAN